VTFKFSPLLGCSLHIVARKVTSNIEILYKLEGLVPATTGTGRSSGSVGQIEALIKLAANSLIDSLLNEIGSIIMVNSRQSNSISGGDEDNNHYDDGSGHDHDGDDGDDGIVAIDEEDLDMDVFNREAKDYSAAAAVIPDQATIDAMWTESDVIEGSIDVSGPIDHDSLRSDRGDYTTETAETSTAANTAVSSSILLQSESDTSWNNSYRQLVYQWSSVHVDSARPSIAMALDNWSRKFAGRGVGIEAVALSDGIRLSISISDLVSIDFRILSDQAAGTVRVLSGLVDSTGCYISPEPELTNASVQSLLDANTAPLVRTLIGNLQESMKSYLGEVYVPKMDSSIDITDQQSMDIGTAVSDVQEQGNIVTRENIDKDCVELHSSNASSEQSIPLAPAVDGAVVSQTVFDIEAVDEQVELPDAINAFQAANQLLKSKSSTDMQGGGRRNRLKDPVTEQRAQVLGLRLEKFEGMGMEDSAMKELNEMLSNSRQQGFLQYVKTYKVADPAKAAAENASQAEDSNNNNSSSSSDRSARLSELFQMGKELSTQSLQDLLNRPRKGVFEETTEDLLQPTTQLPIFLKDNALAKGQGGVDIFQSPYELYGTVGDYQSPMPASSSAYMQQQREERSNTPPDIVTYDLDKQRMNMLITELNRTAVEMHDTVIDGYRDLLLSDNCLFLLRLANQTTFEWDLRQLYRKITEKSIYLTAELGALVKTESVRHLQTIQDICEIAAELQHEEVKFLERMQYVKPRLDTALLSYLNYAMREESIRLRQVGIDAAACPSPWMQILQIVKQGTLAEFESRYAQLLDPLLLIVRFDDPVIRGAVFERFVAITPPMELPYMKALALNMIANILSRSDPRYHDLDNKPYSSLDYSNNPLPNEASLVKDMKNLKVVVDKYLADEVIEQRIAAFEEEVRQQGKRIIVRNRNPAIQSEMDAMREISRNSVNNMLKSDDRSEYSNILE
jgi:hypothetical protein